MGKNKNKNKASGAEKTAAKTEKNLANKLKKELVKMGEEDIATVVAEIEKEEAKRSAASEKYLKGAPSPRAFGSLIPHPTNNELIMFGGDYNDGSRTEVYNDLLFFNPDKGMWKQVKAPRGPGPRSGHQTIASPSNKGELWVFGGEFVNPTDTQFYHYKDLWCFSLADKKWEKILAPNGPSPRSGHRMVQLGRKLLVFGGYNDDGRLSRYFDDLYAFCLDTRTWTKLNPSGRGPCARSGCVVLPAGNDSIFIYGGYSRVREGRRHRTQTHKDLFRLTLKGEAWSWRAQTGGIHAPPARAGQAAAVNPHSQRGYVFGGVSDVEVTEEEIRGEMTDDLHRLDLATGTFHDVTLRSDQAPAAERELTEAQEVQNDVTALEAHGFTFTLGGAVATASAISTTPASRRGQPSPRMSAMTTVQRSTLYVYGGLLEVGDRQFYLSDMYSLDLHKLDKWKTIHEQPPLPDWAVYDSEGWESSSGSDSESD